MALFSVSNVVNAQGFNPQKGFKQLNFGFEFDGYGLPVYLGLDFGVAEMITIGPRIMFASESNRIAGYDNRWSVILPSFRGDYHFSGHINELPSELDIYGGASVGVAMVSYEYDYIDGFGNEREAEGSDSELELWIQLGARYYFTPKWAVQLEFASYGTNGSLGVSYKF